MVDRLTAEGAIERIRRHRDRNRRILGVDGFRTAPGGFVAPLDLILDLSRERLSVGDAAAAAEAFVRSPATDDVTFEITV